VEEMQRLGALSVRGNHDDEALAAYEDFQRRCGHSCSSSSSSSFSNTYRLGRNLPGRDRNSTHFARDTDGLLLEGRAGMSRYRDRGVPPRDGDQEGQPRDGDPGSPMRDLEGPKRELGGDLSECRGVQPDQDRPWLKDVSPDTAHWMRQLPFSLYLPSHNILVVHAGVVPDVPPRLLFA
jgi:hypothetical protein